MSTKHTFDEWVKKFQPIPHPRGCDEGIDCEQPDGTSAPCRLETFGDDFQHVFEQPNTRVWTVVSADYDDDDPRIETDPETGDTTNDSGWYICEGIHHVNRIGYLVTRIPHDFKSDFDGIEYD